MGGVARNLSLQLLLINNGGHRHHNHDGESSLPNDRKAPCRERQQDASSLRTEAGAIPPFSQAPLWFKDGVHLPKGP